MRKFVIALGVSACLSMLLCVGCNHHKEGSEAKKISPDEIPANVMTAINTRFPGQHIDSVEKELEDNNVVYDVELKHQGRKYEMDIKEDGTVMEIEKEVKDAPAAVKKTIQAKYPNSTIKEVMEKNTVKGRQETPESYEVTITTSDGKTKEVVVGLDGSTAKEEPEEKK